MDKNTKPTDTMFFSFKKHAKIKTCLSATPSKTVPNESWHFATSPKTMPNKSSVAFRPISIMAQDLQHKTPEKEIYHEIVPITNNFLSPLRSL